MTGRFYGKLRLIAGGSKWEMTEAEPHVVIRLKQLFPRIPKTSTGPFQFPNDLPHSADLDWFTQRYPMVMDDLDRQALTGGRLGFESQQAELERILLPDYRPPAYVGLKPGQVIRHYQSQAIELLRRVRGLLLGDEGGLGKTYTAAGFFVSEPDALPAAVVVEPHVQKQWGEKLQDFTNLRVHLVERASPYDLPPADVTVFRYSQIAGWVDLFARDIFKSAVYDEPQQLRTGTKSAKGCAANVLSDHTTWHLGLTASPIYNYGIEIFTILEYIRKGVLGDRDDFLREWVNHAGRIEDPKALGTYLREQHVFLRRTKADVGLELPKVSRITETIDYDAKTVQSVEDLAHQLAIKASTGTFLERGKAARDLDIMVRQQTGIAKAKNVAHFVRMLVEGGEPVILIGWHRAVYDIWLKELADLNPAMFTGSETAAQKDRAKTGFVEGQTDLMFASLRSGAGLDGLQHRCSTLVFGELDWSPGVHQQWIWRVDREGQTMPVTAFFLVTDDGSDPPMMEVLGLKSSESMQIVDPHLGVHVNEVDESHLQKLVQRYLAKRRGGGKVGTVATEVVGLPTSRLPQQLPRPAQAELLFAEPA